MRDQVETYIFAFGSALGSYPYRMSVSRNAPSWKQYATCVRIGLSLATLRTGRSQQVKGTRPGVVALQIRTKRRSCPRSPETCSPAHALTTQAACRGPARSRGQRIAAMDAKGAEGSIGQNGCTRRAGPDTSRSGASPTSRTLASSFWSALPIAALLAVSLGTG